MCDIVLYNKSFYIFLNRRIFFVQNFFSFKHNFLFFSVVEFWFIYLQKNLYRFGLRMPFRKFH